MAAYKNSNPKIIAATFAFFLMLFLESCSSSNKESILYCSLKKLTPVSERVIPNKGNTLYVALIENTFCTLKKVREKYKNTAVLYFSFKKTSAKGSSFIHAPFFISIVNAKTKKIYDKKIYPLNYDTKHQELSSFHKAVTLNFTLPKEVKVEDLLFLTGFQIKDPTKFKKNKEKALHLRSPYKY